MKKINIFLTIISIVLLLSCNKDFLNEPPTSLYAENVVWSDPGLVETFVNELYRGLGYAEGVNFLSSFVDETDFTPDWGTSDFNKSLLTSDRIPALIDNNIHYGAFSWSNLYKNVRSCNIFFEKVGTVNFDDVLTDGKTKKERLKGEVFFWRANNYFHLTSLYGGVPIITDAFTLSDSFSVARKSYEECINFIVKDLDSAAFYLPDVKAQSGDNKGRVTKGAALTLKARVLMYAASDLHNPQKNGVVTNGYSNPELVGYTGGDPLARWQAAKDAAKAVMDLGHYDLYKKEPGPSDQLDKNYGDIFLLKETSEDIFVRYFISKINEDWNSYSPGKYVGPNGYHNWGNNCPLEEFVSSYEMKDGTKFDWANPAMAADPYKDRDPRFYASVLYEGAPWRQRPVDAVQYDPFNKIQVGQIGYMENGNFVIKTIGDRPAAGVDTRLSKIEDWNGGYTGYYMKKFIDPSVDHQFFNQENPWRYMRYSEVLLNYAEACIELGQDAEARTYINMIRHRVGLPDVTESGAALKARYRNERKVELAFEEHRFFDVRRWLIGPEAYNGGYKVQVRYIVDKNAVITNYRKDDGSTWGNPEITKVPFTDQHVREWNDKAYFMPIFRDEINKSHGKLIENPGYTL